MSQPPAARRLILASRSPQRIQLLTHAQYAFVSEPADIDETIYPPELLPSEIAQHLARMKAAAVSPRFKSDVVLAADTVVAFGDVVLGKPNDAAHATSMIRLLAGTTHVVISGVAVVCQDTGFNRSSRVMSAVRMRNLTERQIAQYVTSGDWEGKAGGYGIQNIHKHLAIAAGDPFIQCVTGCESNVIGLPMPLVKNFLEAAGVFPEG